MIPIQANIVGLIKNDITLHFSIEDASPPVLLEDIQWSYDRAELQEDGEHVLFSVDKLAVTITNLSLSDEGVYSLMATNPAGSDSATITMDVQSMSDYHRLQIIVVQKIHENIENYLNVNFCDKNFAITGGELMPTVDHSKFP